MAKNPTQPMFVTWNDEKGKQLALTTASQASADYGAIATKSHSVASDIFLGAGPNTGVRDGMSRRDWDYFRPEEAIPKNVRGIMLACMMAYKRMGIVRNTIDVMGEFTCQGIRIVHPNPGIQKLLENWAKRVNFYERSERFCNYLYRAGNVIVQRETALVKGADLENLRQGWAATDKLEKIEPPPKIRPGELPWEYTFINPLSLDILGGEELSAFAGVALFGLVIPEKILSKIKNPKSEEEKYVVAQLPSYILEAVKSGVKIVPLDPNKVKAFFYKKDDWQIWAEPITYGIIDDLILYNKMRLADLSALDGAISHIRLWKLGDLANRILPTPAAINRLAEVLCNNSAVGAVDLIWGPELTFQETSTEVHRFLGPEKYVQTITNIYDGLGVPAPSQGSNGGKSGGMASYLSLKIMIERLKYGRTILNSFWEPELALIQRSLGIRFPAQIQYDYMVLSDENAHLRLMIELADRDLIAVETIQEMFGQVPEIQQLLIRKEHAKRDNGKMKPKAGPYHQPQVEDDLLKIFAQQGLVTPNEAGVELGDRAPGEKSGAELKNEALQMKAAQKAGPTGVSGQGRPSGKKDTGVRKKRKLAPVKAAEFFSTRAWANDIQTSIADIVNPVFVESCEKKNVRSLTVEDTQKLEDFKFAILCNLQPYSEFNEEVFKNVLTTSLAIPDLVQQLFVATANKFEEKFHRKPNIDEIRLFQAEVYSLYVEADNDFTNGDDNGDD